VIEIVLLPSVSARRDAFDELCRIVSGTTAVYDNKERGRLAKAEFEILLNADVKSTVRLWRTFETLGQRTRRVLWWEEMKGKGEEIPEVSKDMAKVRFDPSLVDAFLTAFLQ